MKINKEKTKVILFSNAKKYDFQPNLHLKDGVQLEVVEEIKLLGVQIRSDLSWKSNTVAICQRGFARLWMLRRLKPLGATVAELLDVYDKQIRCVVEFATPVWTASLTKAEIAQIERVQKCAFAIILADSYRSYSMALSVLGRTTLETRRTYLNTRFAKQSVKSTKFKHWFCEKTESEQSSKTRYKDSNVLVPVQARTRGFEKSPLAYLTELINNEK